MKILIVDDSSTFRMLFKTRFDEMGHETVMASNGEEALQLFLTNDFDLITLDVEMPGMSGYQVCSKIREEEKKTHTIFHKKITPVLFVTALDTLEGRMQGFEAGGTDFITKPFSKQEIETAIENIFNPSNAIKDTTILIADDVSISRMIIAKIIQDKGGKTLEAENGKDALDLVRDNADKIDLIITDLFMPEMNGDDFCFRVRNQLGLKTIPVIFLTAASDNKYLLNVFKSGGTDYITKPFVKEEFISRLNVHCNSFRMNRSLEEKIDELKRLNVLKDKFLAVCSHDLRSPLNGILGFSELLLMDEEIIGTTREHLNLIKSSGDYLLTLINNLLDIASIEYEKPLEITEIDLPEILQESFTSAKVQAQVKNIHVTYLDGQLTEKNIMGNKIALKRIINNIFSNALKFTPNSGTVKIGISQPIENLLEISISDSGIGVSQEDLPVIFNKFSRASRPGTKGEKGTGLGLSITKGLVQQMHGNIFVESTVGKGTTFRIQFPVCLKT